MPCEVGEKNNRAGRWFTEKITQPFGPAGKPHVENTGAPFGEYHQSQLPSRTGAFRDVLLDSAGAIALQLVVAFLLWRRGKRLPVEADDAGIWLGAEETSNLPCEVVPAS